MIFVVVIVVGVAIAGVSVRQHLGRTPSSRSWAHGMTRSLAERKVLVLWPLIAIFLVGAGALGLAQDTAAAVPLGLLTIAALLLFGAYAVLPLPIPRVVMPRWYPRRG